MTPSLTHPMRMPLAQLRIVQFATTTLSQDLLTASERLFALTTIASSPDSIMQSDTVTSRQQLMWRHLNAVAVVEPVAPSTGRICQRHVAESHVAASGEEDDTRKRLFKRELALVPKSRPVGIHLFLDVVLSVAVYDTIAGYGNPIRLFREDEACVPSAREVLALDVLDVLPFGEIRDVWRGKEPRRAVDVEFHAGAKLD